MPEIWDKDRDYLKTSLAGMRLELPLGIHPWEHDPRRPQLVNLDVDLFWAAPEGFRPDGIHDVVDYERLRNDILAWSRHGHTPLIETLLEELIEICFRDSRVAAAQVSMAKIGVFNDAVAAGVTLYRRRRS